MLCSLVDAQVAHQLGAQLALVQHAFDRFSHHALWELALDQHFRGAFLDTTRVSGVMIVFFIVVFAAGEDNLLRVDDNDIVTSINVWGESRLVLAAQASGD